VIDAVEDVACSERAEGVVDFSLDRRIELKTRRPLLERQAERGQRARRDDEARGEITGGFDGHAAPHE
jgi:hypothetical protein